MSSITVGHKTRGRPFRFVRLSEEHVKSKGAKYKKPVHETTMAMQQYLLHGKRHKENKNTFVLDVIKKKKQAAFHLTISIQQCALMIRGKTFSFGNKTA